MKKGLLAQIFFVLLIASVPSYAFKDTQRYSPPPKKGTIYIVVKFKPYSSSDQMRMDEKTRISVRWGSWSRSTAYGRGRLSLRFKDGFVIAIRHAKDDSVPVVVESEGSILFVRLLDSPPPKWNDSKYDRYNW